MSYAVQTKKHDYADDLHTVDTDSYQFVVDTGTTFHVCKHRELFFGEISKARHIYTKRVDGIVLRKSLQMSGVTKEKAWLYNWDTKRTVNVNDNNPSVGMASRNPQQANGSRGIH